jgi:hypothetical protein
MQVVEYRIPYTQGQRVKRIYPLGDTHFGTLHCSEDKIKAQIQIIRDDPDAYWVGMGDLGEFISRHDPRFDGKCISKWVDPNDIAGSQIDFIVGMLSPIKHKGIGLLFGNHEEAYRRHQDGDPQKHICERLGLENLGYSCYIDLVFERNKSNEHHRFPGVVSHGAGGAITSGAKMTRLERFMDNFNARWYAHGHTHDIIVKNKPYIDLTDGGKIVSRTKAGAMTGSWFTAYTQDIPASYSEIKNYPPNIIGCPIFEFDPSIDYVGVRGV